MSINIPPKFRRENSDKYCLQEIKMFCLFWTGYVMIFIKRPPTGGTGKLFLSNNVHALTSYILGNFDRIGTQAKNTKPLTRPCYESIPSAWKSGTNSSINDTYCFPVTTKNNKENRCKLAARGQNESQPIFVVLSVQNDTSGNTSCVIGNPDKSGVIVFSIFYI